MRSPRIVRVLCGVLFSLPLVQTVILLLRARGADGFPATPVPRAGSDTPDDYVHRVAYSPAERTLVYGDEAKLRTGHSPPLDDAHYAKFVASMPIVCVDVLLTRQSDGKVLLVRRHTEPVRALHWFPGGRLLKGESFFEAARRKLRKEVNLTDVQPCALLGTWNTLFERSAWGGMTHTVNILVHVQVADARADLTNLHICGDRRGRCADGSYGHFRWISDHTESGETTYVLEGLRALRERHTAGRISCDHLGDHHATTMATTLQHDLQDGPL